jgi:Raf kinase inhibitor-like YbhB/YbcL family protein
MTFLLHSAVFLPGEPIPSRYTCEAEDVSPPLAWMDPPQATKSFLLIMEDPDAPDPAAPKQVWLHWVLYNIPAATRAFSEAIRKPDLPPGTLQGLNDWNRTGYRGPCPPVGRHRYFFRLRALDIVLSDLGVVNRADLERAVEGHVVGEAVLMGTYRKSVR